MENIGGKVIRDHMPEQHRDFYQQLPYVFVGHTDSQGWPWASILSAPVGFIQSPGNKTLTIEAAPLEGDPLKQNLHNGQRLGLLGIELHSKRRNRINAKVSGNSNNKIELAVLQSFGNCPKYIRTRYYGGLKQSKAMEITALSHINSQAHYLIKNADTFFVASGIEEQPNSEQNQGADVSHRGGKPGFIRIEDDQTITIPDYSGNGHFNTLGNFELNPRAGLLFIDFERGHILSMTGTVEVIWENPNPQYFPNADRLWQFTIKKGVWLNGNSKA
jgi:predicted pyridoxine 5'-phosphate oxidase superfamily flavin-nucleotide-binding protein